MKKSTLVSVIIVLASVPAYTQETYSNWAFYIFSMGQYPRKLYIPSVNIQIDSSFYANISKTGIDFSLSDPYLVYMDNKEYNSASAYLDLDPAGNLKSNSRVHIQKEKFKVSAHFWDRKFVFPRVLAVGNIHLPGSHAKKIKWLDMDLSNGRVTDFKDYTNLAVVNTVNTHLKRIHKTSSSLNLSNTDLHYYPGDPFLWQSMSQVPLQGLSLQGNVNHFISYEPGNIYFLDEGISELIATKKLKTLDIENAPYFPVNFQDFASIEHLTVRTLSAPEKVNLLMVMRSFNKENIANLFLYSVAIDTTVSLTIPTNGTYTSNYKNGQVVCTGNYTDGKPDGKWTFYYDNGQTCQERYYQKGSKEGSWIFFNPDGDTITQFLYGKNQLLHRKDTKIQDKHSCTTGEFSYDVKSTSEYHLTWKNANEVFIEKKLYSIVLPTYFQHYKIGDTLSSFQETWNFNATEWEYFYTDRCIDQVDFQPIHLKGKLGEVPYFSEGSEIRKSSSYHSALNWTIDFKNCYWEYHHYSNQNKQNEFRLEKTDKQNILPSEGICK